MFDGQILALPGHALDAWLPELALVGTVLLGLLTGGVGRRDARGRRFRPHGAVRLVVPCGLAVSAILAGLTRPAMPVQPLGPHFTVDGTAVWARTAILIASLLTLLALVGRSNPRASTMLALATLGLVLLAEAATAGGLLLASAVFLVGCGLVAWFQAPEGGRKAARRWYLTATAGFLLLSFGTVLWSGVGGTLDLGASLRGLAHGPFLPPGALPAILALLAVGLALVLLGEPGRFASRDPASKDGSAPGTGRDERARGSRICLPPALTGWLTAVPPLSLAALLTRWLRGASLEPLPGLLTCAAAVLLLGGYLAALTRESLERRLAWAATGQVGLALLGFSVPSGSGGPSTVLPLLLVFAAAQLGALLLAGVLDDLGPTRRHRYFLPLLTAGLLLALTGLPPMAGWRPRLDLLQALLVGDHYLGAGLVLVGTLMGCFVYLRPLVDLWRPDVQPVQQGSDPTDEHGAGPLRAAGALLGAAALLALLLAWGTGLLGLAGGLS